MDTINSEEQLKNDIRLESFTYIASHDLQEPLRKIKTFSGKLLEEEYKTHSPKGKKYFERLTASVGRMQNLIEDLLDYTRLSVNNLAFTHSDLKNNAGS